MVASVESMIWKTKYRIVSECGSHHIERLERRAIFRDRWVMHGKIFHSSYESALGHLDKIRAKEQESRWCHIGPGGPWPHSSAPNNLCPPHAPGYIHVNITFTAVDKLAEWEKAQATQHFFDELTLKTQLMCCD